MKIQFFDQHIEKFIEELDKPTIAKTLRTLDLLEQFGNRLSMPHSKKVDHDMFELRVRGKKEVRILYGFHNRSIILLHAFQKKTQKLPKRHIDLAKKHLQSLAPL